MQYDTGKHCVFYHRYHIVWSTKYRYKVLTGGVRLRVRDIIRQVRLTRYNGNSLRCAGFTGVAGSGAGAISRPPMRPSPKISSCNTLKTTSLILPTQVGSGTADPVDRAHCIEYA